MMRQRAGYTILEAMIFLAVSGVLFALVIPSYINRQDKVRFTQGVRDLDSKINDVINDVSNGYFPAIDGTCNASSTPPALAPGGTSTQGQRKDCIFIGKAIHVNASVADKPSLDIFTVVGAREVSGSRPTSLAVANPGTVSIRTGSTLDITENYGLKWAPEVGFVGIVGPTPATQLGTFGIFADLGSSDSTKKLNIHGVSGSDTSPSTTDSSDDPINAVGNLTTHVNPAKGIIICLRDPKTQQQAAILVGGRAGAAKTEVVFDKNNIDSIEAGICG